MRIHRLDLTTTASPPRGLLPSLWIAALMAASALLPGADAQAEDWSVTKNELSTAGSHDMTVSISWEVNAKPDLAASNLLFLPFQGIRVSLEEWSLQRVDISGSAMMGSTSSETCSVAAALVGDISALMGGLQVDPNAPDAQEAAQTLATLFVSNLAGDLGAGLGQPALQSQYDFALETLVPGCEVTLTDLQDSSDLEPGLYRADVLGNAALVEMLTVQVNPDGSLGLGAAEPGAEGNLNLGAEAHPVKKLREDAPVQLRCPAGTSWNWEESYCALPSGPSECPAGLVPGTPEYCACWGNHAEDDCLVCEFSDGSYWPSDPSDPPVDDASTLNCHTEYSWLYEDGLTCAVIELFCLGGTFPRPKTLPPGTTGEPLMGCSDGLSWGPCPNQPEGLPLLVPNRDPAEGFPDCWRVGEVIVNPVPGVCENSASSILPDLVVESVHLSEGLPSVGEDFILVVRVRNEGSFVAPSSEVRLTLETPIGPLEVDFLGGSLNPGQERQMEMPVSQIPYDPVPGVHTAVALADPANAVAELMESNNSAETTFTVGTSSLSGHDLSVGELHLHPDHPTDAAPVQVKFSVRNSGTTAVVSTEYQVRVDHGSVSTVETFPVEALQPAESSEETYTLPSAEAGAYSVSILVDSGDLIAEANEDNNTATRTFTVEADEGECLPCTSGEPNNAVGAFYCTDPADPTLPPWQGHLYTCLGVRANGTSCETSGIHPNGWGYVGPRCPDPATLFQGPYHSDFCGNPGVCPGTKPLPF